MTRTLIREALDAVRRGFHIFPVEPGQKTPIRIYQDRPKDDAPWTVRWSEIATDDVETVVRWWTHAPLANVGVACKQSGLLVVDCDQPKKDGLLNGTPWSDLHALFGPRVDGETLFDYVAQRLGGGVEAVRDAFDTYAVATGSGGLHLYYRWPDGVQSTQDSIVKGVLDVRGNGGERGGYVLGEGSQTEAGSYVLRHRAGIRDAPPWLVALVRERRNESPVRISPFHRPRNPNFGGLVEQVRTAYEGNRNQALLWAARAMCADGASEEDAAALLTPAYVENGGPGGERQAHQTIRSAFRLQTRKMT